MGLAWQQGPLASGAVGHFLTPQPMPERILYAEPLRRRMRVKFGDQYIADSEDVVLLHEPGRYPVAYFPRGDVQPGVLIAVLIVQEMNLSTVKWLVAVVIADLIATGASAQRLVERDPRPPRRLRGDAFHAFVLAATLPVLVLASVDGQLTAARQEADSGARLHEAAAALTEHISAYVNDHQRAVKSLAAALTAQPPDGPSRQTLLDQYHEIYPGFVTLFDVDRAGVVRQIVPPRDPESPPIGDREYFIEAMRTRRTAISDVIVGRLSHVPIVTIAVPILAAAVPRIQSRVERGKSESGWRSGRTGRRLSAW